MRNADAIAAEAAAATIAENVGIVRGASDDERGVGAGAATSTRPACPTRHPSAVPSAARSAESKGRSKARAASATVPALGVRLTRSGKIKAHVASSSNVALFAVLGALTLVTVFTLVTIDYGRVAFPVAMAAALEDFLTMMLQPGLGGHFTLPEVVEGLFVSLALALLTTFIGAAIAFVLGLLARPTCRIAR